MVPKGSSAEKSSALPECFLRFSWSVSPSHAMHVIRASAPDVEDCLSFWSSKLVSRRLLWQFLPLLVSDSEPNKELRNGHAPLADCAAASGSAMVDLNGCALSAGWADCQRHYALCRPGDVEPGFLECFQCVIDFCDVCFVHCRVLSCDVGCEYDYYILI